MFLESSKDILNLVIAFSVLWFTAFVCWALYYLISILRDTARLIEDVREKLDALQAAIEGVKERMAKSASALGTMATGAKFLMELFERRAEKAMKKAAKVAKDVKKKAKQVKKELEGEDFE